MNKKVVLTIPVISLGVFVRARMRRTHFRVKGAELCWWPTTATTLAISSSLLTALSALPYILFGGYICSSVAGSGRPCFGNLTSTQNTVYSTWGVRHDTNDPYLLVFIVATERKHAAKRYQPIGG